MSTTVLPVVRHVSFPELHHTVCHIFDRIIMCNHNNGISVLLVHRLDELQYLLRGVVVQRAGRLVAQQQLRVLGKRSGNGHALLLAAGKLRREVVHAMRKAHLRKHLRRIKRIRADLAGKLNVLERRKVLNQVIELEHEADIQTAVLRELTFGESADLAPIKRDGAGRA